jgi:hypothetical protein
LVVHGFQLYADDRLIVIPESEHCTIQPLDSIEGFKVRNNPEVSFDRDMLTFPNVTSTITGYFRLCLIHFQEIFDIGTAAVRPACQPESLVMIEGICVEHCPKTKVPVAGECQTDPVALQPVDDEAILISLRLKQSQEAANMEVFSMSWEDPERQQFVYQFSSEMGKFLNVDLGRFRLVSISNGSVIMNVVLVPEPDLTSSESSERSPRGLLSLLRSMQSDEISAIYSNKFFQNVDREYAPPAVHVRQCDDSDYRVICQHDPQFLLQPSSASFFFFGSTLAGIIVLIGLCGMLWTFDRDIKHSDIADAQDDGTTLGLKPEMESEFARSWLENRHTLSAEEVKKNANRKAIAMIKNASKASKG